MSARSNWTGQLMIDSWRNVHLSATGRNIQCSMASCCVLCKKFYRAFFQKYSKDKLSLTFDIVTSPKRSTVVSRQTDDETTFINYYLHDRTMFYEMIIINTLMLTSPADLCCCIHKDCKMDKQQQKWTFWMELWFSDVEERF